MADSRHRFFESDKVAGTALRCRPFFGAHGVTRPTRSKDRIERILREHVFDICDQQFLMLLFVMSAQNKNCFDFVEQFFVGIRKEVVNVQVDRGAIALRFLDCRP